LYSFSLLHQKINTTPCGSVISNHELMWLSYRDTNFCLTCENSTLNYLAYNFSENVDVLESKVEQVVFIYLTLDAKDNFQVWKVLIWKI